MSQLKKYPFAYAAALCAFLALGAFFLPNLYALTPENTQIFVFGHILAFGGEVVQVVDGSLYSFSFATNIFALVLIMCLFLSGIASLLSKESAINRTAAALLAVAGIVLSILLPSHVGQAGMAMAYGAWLSIVFAALSAICDILAFVFGKRLRGSPTPKEAA